MAGRITKNTEGYGYKYADLAEIHKYLEGAGLSYYQFIKINEQGVEQIFTKRDDMDEPIPGCKVPQATLSGKSNPAQEYGSALTYARRYSLLMAYGLATEDDDAESLTASTNRSQTSVRRAPSNRNEQTDALTAKIKKYADEHGMTMQEIAKDYHLTNQTATADRLQEVYNDLTSASTSDSNESTVSEQTSMADDFAAIDEQLPF